MTNKVVNGEYQIPYQVCYALIRNFLFESEFDIIILASFLRRPRQELLIRRLIR